MAFWSFLSNAVKPLTDMVDNLHTSDEERGQVKAQILALQNSFAEKLLDYEQQLLTSQTNIIVAEANGGGWLQKSWRPITMLTFLVLVVCDSFGWLANPLAPQAWTLLQIGLGGYVAGRSLEKITPKVIDRLGKK